MKNCILKNIILYILILICAFAFHPTAYGQTTILTASCSLNMQQYIDYIISSTIAENNECTWTPSTRIFETIPLFDLEDNHNGYIFNLNNGEQECGYIQIAIIDNAFYLVCYCFEGHNAIKDELEQKQKINFKLAEENPKIIYTGSMNYVIKQGNQFFDLVSKENVTSTYSDFYNQYNTLKPI